MTDRPIIFSAHMVRALIAGRKTQTRRIMRLPPAPNKLGAWEPSTIGGEGICDSKGRPYPERACIWHTRTGQVVVPRFGAGDRLYVREAWRTHRVSDELAPRMLTGEGRVWFEADRDNCDQHGRLRQGMHMPRWASRLTLIVEEVRVEPLQAITEADAEAEGCVSESADPPFWYVPGIMPYSLTGVGAEEPGGRHAERCYGKLWSLLHTKPGERWEDNPHVVALTFRVEQRNIDASPLSAPLTEKGA